MDRTKFCEKVEVDDIGELDYLRNNLSRFTMQYPPDKYIVSETDLLRPDMISYKAYGDVGFWWIIMYVNDIDCIYIDLVEGMTLDIPSLIDLYNFHKQYALR